MKKIEIVFCTPRKPLILNDVKEVHSLERGVLRVWRIIDGREHLCLYDSVSVYNEEVQDE